MIFDLNKLCEVIKELKDIRIKDLENINFNINKLKELKITLDSMIFFIERNYSTTNQSIYSLVKKHDNRRKNEFTLPCVDVVYKLIKDNPGIYMKILSDMSGFSGQAVRNALILLRGEQKIIQKFPQKGNKIFYFVSKNEGEKE